MQGQRSGGRTVTVVAVVITAVLVSGVFLLFPGLATVAKPLAGLSEVQLYAVDPDSVQLFGFGDINWKEIEELLRACPDGKFSNMRTLGMTGDLPSIREHLVVEGDFGVSFTLKDDNGVTRFVRIRDPEPEDILCYNILVKQALSPTSPATSRLSRSTASARVLRPMRF